MLLSASCLEVGCFWPRASSVADPQAPSVQKLVQSSGGAQGCDVPPLDVEQGSAGRSPDATHGLLTPLPNTGHIRRDLAQVRAAFRMQSLRR